MPEVRAEVIVDNLLDPVAHRTALLDALRDDLTAPQKRLAPVWFYDEAGSNLFDEITRLPEYYLTRAEREILIAHAAEISDTTRAHTLVELGSGTSEKTTILLDALVENGHLARFVPLDVSEETLREAAETLSATYPEVAVHAIVGDFQHHLEAMPDDGSRLVAFLGSTIGNLEPGQRFRFLTDLDAALRSTDWILLGTDLVKDPDVLLAAYDDAAGVTSAFNKNVLLVLNRELDADFDPSGFEHVARWNEDERWIEMRLRSVRDQNVVIPGLELEIHFAEGEELWTEISSKFGIEQVQEELWKAGFVTDKTWLDDDGRFMLTLAHPYC